MRQMGYSSVFTVSHFAYKDFNQALDSDKTVLPFGLNVFADRLWIDTDHTKVWLISVFAQLPKQLVAVFFDAPQGSVGDYKIPLIGHATVLKILQQPQCTFDQCAPHVMCALDVERVRRAIPFRVIKPRANAPTTAPATAPTTVPRNNECQTISESTAKPAPAPVMAPPASPSPMCRSMALPKRSSCHRALRSAVPVFRSSRSGLNLNAATISWNPRHSRRSTALTNRSVATCSTFSLLWESTWET